MTAFSQAASRPANRRPVRWWLMLLWVAVLGLLYLALRDIPLGQVAGALARLDGWQILALALLNLAILAAMTARWWMALRSLGYHVPLRNLLAYRLAGFSVSYFTPGPQFGGEPLQVHLLHSRQGIPLTAAISSVAVDRLIDLLANFTFLAAGSLVLIFTGLAGGWQSSGAGILSIALLVLPLGHLAALARGYRPFAALFGRLASVNSTPILQKVAGLAMQSESQVSALVRERPGVLLRMIGLSAVIWAAAIFEFWLTLNFLGIQAGLESAVSALTAARLAFLLPLPGGLGVLEASQAFAARLLGWDPAVGIAVSLVIRARDVFLAILGAWIAGYLYRSKLFGNRITSEGSQ